MNSFPIIATAAFGIESVVADELRALGYTDLLVENGKVTFQGDELALCRANLWLRSADRIRLKVGEFEATTFEELFEKTKALPWADIITKDGEFPVEGKSVKSTLFSVSDCQAIVKKAIVESLKAKHKVEWFAETGPLFKVEVSLLKDVATLTLDTSGVALHKRGYRRLIGDAPLKETLAAAMILMGKYQPEGLLVDPFCGSGTIPIEAALIGRNIAPGMNREFACEKWPLIDKQHWHQARRETHELADFDRQLQIIGTDIDEQVLKVARRNAEEAGVEDCIHLQQQSFTDFSTKKKYGKLICNPPYGERIGERSKVEEIYRKLGDVFLPLDTWSFYVLTAHRDFERLFGKRATKRRKLFNGNLRVDYYQYFGPIPPKK